MSPDAIQYRVLGPLQADGAEGSIPLGGPKQRTVLAMLLAADGLPVSVDRLIDGVWGEEPTEGARNTLRTYVSNLRVALGDAVERHGDGYRVNTNRRHVDAWRFEDALAEAARVASDDPAEAASVLRAALTMWRGRPFADVNDAPELHSLAIRLEEMRLVAVEQRIEAELALGGHADVVPELEVLTTEHPTRERFRSQHMLALYRSGRQADALRSYQRARTFFTEEMGIDPSPSLQEMEMRILQHDPELDVAAQARVERLAFLFTDIEDSTVLWELHPVEMQMALERHDRIVSGAVYDAGGKVFKGTGDGVYAVFPAVGQALDAAAAAQAGLAATEWGSTPIRARMAVDVGSVEARGGDYFGPPLNRCARVMASGHGGQVLLTGEAQRDIAETPGAGWTVRGLGEYRYKGLGRPQAVFQLVVDDLEDEFPPLRIDRTPSALLGAAIGVAVPGYELREQIGGGDFGVVYRAYQPSVGREVAVKLIRSEFVNKAAFVRRFEAEAQLVAQLEHPHIVALYDFGRDPDQAYLVMRWLRGGSLGDALERGPWHPERALRLLRQIGAALSHAHRHGVVHRDLKPSNVLLDDEGNAYLSDFGIAARPADGSELRVPQTSAPAYLAPEELNGEPLTSRSDLHALGVLAYETLTGRPPPLDEPLPPASRVRPELPSAVDEVIARCAAPDPADRYATAEAFLAALRTALGEEAPEEAPALTPTRNPYKGLRPFQESDAADFFGRRRVIDEIVAAVAAHGLVAVVGPSGIGKSSVVRAGLLPALRGGALPGSREWISVEMYPGSYPFEELGAALLKVAAKAPPDLSERLRQDERGIARVAKEILSDDATLVLVIDQFEELFSLTRDEDERRRFLDGLTALVRDERSRVRVVLTMRADFFDWPLRYADFAELVQAGMVAVASPNDDELGEAIAGPAEGVGVRLEPGLVDRIVRDVHDQPGGLPLLQYALTEMFARRHSDLLTVDGYEASGGVRAAVGRRAERIFDELEPGGRAAARQLFLRLVNVSEHADDTRRRVRRSDLEGLDDKALDDVIERFGAHRLLSFDRDPVTRGPTVEVAHEAMLREWPRLAHWIDERREVLLLHRRFGDAQQEWLDAGERPDYLLTGGRLAQFEAWAGGTDLALTADERRFLDESRRADDRRRARLRRRRRQVLAGFAAAAVVAAMLAVVAYLNQRSARDAERAALAAAQDAADNLVVAEAERERAEEATDQAEVDRAAAIAAAEREAEAREEAEKAAQEAEAQRERAEAQRLIASSAAVIDEDPELALLLALAGASRLEGDARAAAALREAMAASRTIYEYRAPPADALASTSGDISPDGSTIVIGGAPSTRVEARDVGDGTLRWVYEVDAPYPGEMATDAKYVNGGTEVAIQVSWFASLEHAFDEPPPSAGVHVVDAGTGTLLRRFDAGPCGHRFERAETTDGYVVLVGLTDAWMAEHGCGDLDRGDQQLQGLRLDVTTGETRIIVPAWDFLVGPRRIALDVSGDTALVYYPGPRRMEVIDLAAGEILLAVPDIELQSAAVAVSSDGSTVAFSGSGASVPGDVRIQVHDVATGELLATADGHAGGTNNAWFSADGTRLVTSGQDGSVEIWNAASGTLLDTIPGGEAGKTVVGRSADERRLAVFSSSATARVISLDPADTADIAALDGCGSPVRFYLTGGLRVRGGRALVYVFCEDGAYGRVFDTASWELLASGPAMAAQGADLSPDGAFVAGQETLPPPDEFSIRAGTVFTSDLGTGERRLMDGLCAWSFGDFGYLPDAECREAPELPFDAAAWEIDFSPDGTMLALATDPKDSGFGMVWDVATGRSLAAIRSDSVAFSPDSARLVTANTASGMLQLWETDGFAELASAPAPATAGLRFGADGSVIVAVVGLDAPGTADVVVYDAATLEETRRIPAAHEASVRHLDVSGDGAMLATAGTDGVAKVWDLATGELLHTIGVPDRAQAVAFANGDRHLLVAVPDGPVLVFTLDDAELVATARSRLVRGFTAAECAEFFVGESCPALEELTAGS